MAKENIEKEELEKENISQEEVKEEVKEEPAEQEVEVDPLEKAEAEIADLKKQLLYKIAEFDNYRKRTMAEKVELIMNGGEKTITAILPVMDDMERALEQMKKAEDVSAVVEGILNWTNWTMKNCWRATTPLTLRSTRRGGQNRAGATKG